MLSRFNVVTCLTALGAVVAVLASCRSDEIVALTKPPVRSTSKVETRPVATAVFAGFAIDPQEALKAAETLLPERIVRINETVSGAACGQRVKDIECAGGRVEGEISRSGPLELTAQDGRLVLKVPMAYTLAMRGNGWAAGIQDTRTGTLTAVLRVEAVLLASYTLEPAIEGSWQWSERQLVFGHGQLDVAKSVQPKLHLAQSAFVEKVTGELASLPVLTTVQRAWRLLHQPFVLTRTPETWLLAEPVRIGNGGFQQDGQTLLYRVAIGVRSSLHDSKPAVAPVRVGTVNRLPEPGRSTPEMGATQLRLPVLVGLDRLQAAIARSFPLKEKFVSQADKFADAVDVATRRVQIYPSHRQLALELDLDILQPKAWSGRKGRLHLLGRPLLDPTREVIVLDSVSMPAPTARDARDDRDPAPPGLRLGMEPFAARFASAVKLDIAPDVRNAVAQVNASLERQADEQVTMTAHFDSGQATAIEPVAEGLMVMIDLRGHLTLHVDAVRIENTAYEGASVAGRPAVGPAAPKPRARIADR